MGYRPPFARTKIELHGHVGFVALVIGVILRGRLAERGNRGGLLFLLSYH